MLANETMLTLLDSFLHYAAGDPWDTFRRTLSGRFYVPHFITDAAADLIFKLLQVGQHSSTGAGLHDCLVLT